MTTDEAILGMLSEIRDLLLKAQTAARPVYMLAPPNRWNTQAAEVEEPEHPKGSMAERLQRADFDPRSSGRD